MTISIPESLFDKYKEFVDYLLSDEHFSKNCTLVYPPLRTECPNCTINMVGSSVINTYRHGGPAPFNFGDCSMCGGQGYKEVEHTGSLRLRIYWNRKDWIKIVKSIVLNDADVMVIGNMSDLRKFKQAIEILLITSQNNAEYRTVLVGQPTPWGFSQDKYFIAYLKGV
jgi:hypothetical protein